MNSIIILTYNGVEDTKVCVRSIFENQIEDYELIFVDNNSTDDTLTYLNAVKKQVNKVKFLKNVKILTNEKRIGFSAACNQGIMASESNYPIVCNNDIYTCNAWSTNLINSMKKHKEFAVMVATSDNCGNPLQWFSHPMDIKPSIIAVDDANFITFCIDKIFWKEHKLDENYISGVEDIDMCWQIQMNNRLVGVCLASFVHHEGSKTNKREFKDTGMSENLNKGWDYFIKKWGPAGELRFKDGFGSYISCNEMVKNNQEVK